MMKKILLLILTISIFLPACRYNSLQSKTTNANTTVRSEVRDVSGFRTVRLGNNFALELTAGAPYNFSVEGDDALIGMVSTKVQDEELMISLDKKYSRDTKVLVKISMPELTELETSGGSTALVTGMKGDALKLLANGATAIKISGEVKMLEAHGYGGSKIIADGLKLTDADVEAFGTAMVTLSPTGKLKALTKGVAVIEYTGNPKIEKVSPDTNVRKKE